MTRRLRLTLASHPALAAPGAIGLAVCAEYRDDPYGNDGDTPSAPVSFA